MGIFDNIGDAVEDAAESVTEKAGGVADAGLDAAASAARWAGADGTAEALDDLGDHLVDLTGGEVDERELGETEDPTELVRGEPAAIGHAAEQLRQLGDSIGQTGDALRQVDVADWTGRSADAFRAEFDQQPKLWWDGSDAMHASAGVLDTWFHEVSAAQAKAADAVAQWRQADTEERSKKSAWNALSNEAKKNTPLVDTWSALRDAARETLRGARTQRDNAANSAVSGLSAATESAPTEPPFTERMAANYADAAAAEQQARGDFTKGLVTSLTGIVQIARQVTPLDTYNMTHPAQYLQGMSDLGTGMVVAAADPGATVSSFLSDARKNPAEFAGALTGDAVTTAATGGGGAAKSALSAVREVRDAAKAGRAGRAATDAAEGAAHPPPGRAAPHTEAPPHTEPTTTESPGGHPESSHPGSEPPHGDTTPSGPEQPPHDPSPEQRADADQGAHDTARDSGPEHDRTEHEKTCSEDPVDIATGEFLLPETDLDLPGVLALVLRRTHRSGYRYGRWFGPSWSATLDMRLVTEHEGVTFLGEDGIMLAYPHAEVGTATQPVTGGRRWTLTRTDMGGYRIWDQQRELIWHFAPEPGLAGLDARLGNYAISAITDRHRNRIRFHYDADGAPVEISHSGGYRVLVDTAAGRVTGLSVLDRDGAVRIRDFGYSAGELISVTNGADATTRYTYLDHRMTSWIDSNGNQMVNTYDESGRVLFQRGTDGVLNSDFDYLEFPDGTGSLTTVTDALGAVTRHGFDHDLQLRDLLDPAGGRTRIDYNLDRRPLRVTAPDGAATQYTYTGEGDVASLTRPDGRTVSIDYMFRNRPSRVVDADGAVRHQEWNGDGDLIATVDTGGARTEYARHPNGSIARITESTSARTLIDTDAAGLPVAVTDPHGAVTRVERDGFGRPLTITDPFGATTRHEWSATGKLLRRIDPDGHAEAWTYDGEGNVTSHTDRAGGLTRFSYGAFDLLSSRAEPDGTHTYYSWDAQRRLTAVTNPLGQRWTYDYDLAGRLTAETDYTGATTRYTYDRVGRLTTVTAATGVTRHHSHDILGRLTDITADTGEYTRYTHDAAGRILTAATGVGEDPTHTLHFAYTAAGLLATQQLDDQPAMRHTYDDHGRRIQRTTPSGATTTWQWDFSHRVTGLTADGHTVTFGYDPLGRPIGWKVGELAVDRTLTSVGRVTDQTVTAYPRPVLNLFGNSDRPDPRQLRHDQFAYRPDGYLTAHTVTRDDAAPDHRDYSLDPIGRVTAITRNGALAEAYTYDPLSNITASLPDLPAAPTSDPIPLDHREYRNNLLIRNGRTRYHYDAAGRLIRKETTRLSRKPDVWHYRYNAFDQLTDVWTPDREWWRYTYDALGRRVSKQRVAAGGEVHDRVEYTWDDSHFIEQQAEGTAIRWTHEPGTHSPLTQTTDHSGSDRTTHAIVTDLVGAPTELLEPRLAHSAASAVKDLWGHTQWDGATDTPLRFPGQIFDDETSLHYNFNRVYDPGTGRYLTGDPLGLGPASNHLNYPHNPTVWNDPLGLIPQGCEGGGSNAGQDPKTPSPEHVDPRPVKPGQAIERWNDFLGSGQHTDMHPRTGISDPDRIVSEDGLRSIRFGDHEMSSRPTKFHYHEETWTPDESGESWHVDNRIVRVPFPKGSW